MGADFLLAIVPIRRSEEEALAALAALSDTALGEAFERTRGWRFEEDWDDTDPDTRVPGETAGDALRRVCETSVREVYQAVAGGSREAARITIDGTDYLTTGGMSWGDSPTDLFDHVDLVEALGVSG